MLKLGDVLGGARHDFFAAFAAERVRQFAFRALVEIALYGGATRNVIRRCFDLLDEHPPVARIFLECCLGSFWRAVLSFLDRLGDRADTSLVLGSLLKDRSLRAALTVGVFVDIDIENPIEPKTSYPAMGMQEEDDLTGDWRSCAAEWISEHSRLPFSKSGTMLIIEGAFSAVLQQSPGRLRPTSACGNAEDRDSGSDAGNPATAPVAPRLTA
jgi:hypothetical protein